MIYEDSEFSCNFKNNLVRVFIGLRRTYTMGHNDTVAPFCLIGLDFFGYHFNENQESFQQLLHKMIV